METCFPDFPEKPDPPGLSEEEKTDPPGLPEKPDPPDPTHVRVYTRQCIPLHCFLFWSIDISLRGFNYGLHVQIWSGIRSSSVYENTLMGKGYLRQEIGKGAESGLDKG